MADGDVLQLDSAQPGGSGEIEGETKFKWGPSSVPVAFEEVIATTSGTSGDGTPFTIPAGKAAMLAVSLETGAVDGDEQYWAFTSGGQMQIFLRKHGGVAGEFATRWVNFTDHDITVRVKWVFV